MPPCHRTSLVIAVISIYVAINLLVAHEESMDILMSITGAILIVLSVYVLWCVARGIQVINPLPEE